GGRNGWSGRSGCARWTATGGWPTRPSRWRDRSASGSIASSPTRSTRGSSSSISGRSSSRWSGSSASWASWSGCSRRKRRGVPTRGSSRSCAARWPPGTAASTRPGRPRRRPPAAGGAGRCYRRGLEPLAQPTAAGTTAEAERDALRDVSRRASERAGELRAQAQELTRATQERAGAERRARDLEAQLGARPTGYDSQRHDAVRAELTRPQPAVPEAGELAARAERAEVLVREAELAEQALTTHE